MTNSGYMFDKCNSLVGGQGTTYNASHVDKTYAHIDGGTSNPGYFSEKGGTFLRGDVNGDNNVSIADVTALIDIVLDGDTEAPYTFPQYDHVAADVNEDSKIDIYDVTMLIDIILYED